MSLFRLRKLPVWLSAVIMPVRPHRVTRIAPVAMPAVLELQVLQRST
jgi:hypothetical protein